MGNNLSIFFFLFVCSAFSACGQSAASSEGITKLTNAKPMSTNAVLETATFGAGCFWCVEAQFESLDGVLSVESGYSGGRVKNPSYKEVCNGTTGHAEVCNVVYDTTKISFDELLLAFWGCHDPTQLNRQGNDQGTQYRSVIYYHNEEQQTKSEFYKKQLNEKNTWGKPVVTEISPYTIFYKAEGYHQGYYENNGSEGYCQFVIKPKLEKFKEVFKDKLKNASAAE